MSTVVYCGLDHRDGCVSVHWCVSGLEDSGGCVYSGVLVG